MAVLHLDTLKLSISQFIEAGRHYTSTACLLDACAPRQVVIVASSHHEVSGGINRAVAAGWDHALLPRSCFDDTKGILAVQELTGWSASGAAAAAGGCVLASHASVCPQHVWPTLWQTPHASGTGVPDPSNARLRS